MSQRAEKYARNMERRLDCVEKQLEKMGHDLIAQGVRVSIAEDNIESTDFRLSRFKNKYESKIRRESLEGRKTARRKQVRFQRAGVVVLLVLAGIALMAIALGAESADQEVTTKVSTNTAAMMVFDCGEEDAAEGQKIEAALLRQGYLSDTVPLTYDLQDVMRTACEQYGCPYPLALAVADWETRGGFDMDAVGTMGEVGIMQLNPGPGGSYHAELEKATGQDPTTPEGNIVCGVYLLGKYMGTYWDPTKAAMAYNMGEDNAQKAWNDGITSTEYTTAVIAAMERWEPKVSTWGGM